MNLFHARADKDVSTGALHHTLGLDHNQASPGDHSHDGRNSKLVGQGLDPTFPSTAAASYNQSQIQDIINALRDLGFGLS